VLAKDIMVTDFISVNGTMEVSQLSRILFKSKTEYLPVYNKDGKTIGMVGTAEIVDFKPGMLVQDIMVPNFISIKIDTTLEEIASIFIMFEKLRQIPVFDLQELVGVISRQAILKALNNRMSLDG
jgi:predicted transcriptional regulator